MHEDLIAQMARMGALRREIHRDEAPPANDAEQQVEIVMTLMLRGVQELIIKGITPSMLESALLYHWLRMATMLQGIREGTFEAFSKHLDKVSAMLIGVMKNTATEIQDAGPTPAMRELGERIQQARAFLGIDPNKRLSRSEAERQADTTNRCIFRIVQDCFEKGVHPSYIESAFLYHWLRISTMNANVPEEFFQRLERNWPYVIDRIRELVQRLPEERL